MDGVSDGEEPVYAYYTIVNDGVGGEEGESNGDDVIYFTVDNAEGGHEEPSTGNEFGDNRDSEELPEYKVISLEEGGLYFTETEEETMIKGSNEILLHDVPDTSLDGTDLLNETATNNDYQEVKFVDGSRAMIDKKLWNSLLENSPQEEEEEEPETKRKFPCQYLGCNKVYSTAQHLTVHIRNHTGDRPYECPVEGCDRAFVTGYSLKAHLRRHTGETPYPCGMCVKEFKTSGDLQKHIRTHTGEKPFKCPIEGCNRSFTTSNIRKVHIRSHTGERPYVCEKEKCGKAFASATNFKNHMRIHSGEKPYVCQEAGCNKRFTEYSSLYKHNMVHKPFKLFKCEYCGQRCKHDSTLRAHKRSCHGLVITQDGTEIEIILQDGGRKAVFETAQQNTLAE